MNKKLIIVGTVATLLVTGVASAFAVYRTKKIESCDSVLTRYNENHLCISTNKGTMVFELYKSSTPVAVERIKKLSNTDKFFDGLEFYRVVKDFVVQGGIQDYQIANTNIANISDTMAAKIKLVDEKFETETNFDKLDLNAEELENLKTDKYVTTPGLEAKKFEYGSISFANAGPNTNSTEIFIVTDKDSKSQNSIFLNGRFTNMGKLVEGESVLASINDLGVKAQDVKPTQKVTIFEFRAK